MPRAVSCQIEIRKIKTGRFDAAQQQGVKPMREKIRVHSCGMQSVADCACRSRVTRVEAQRRVAAGIARWVDHRERELFTNGQDWSKAYVADRRDAANARRASENHHVRCPDGRRNHRLARVVVADASCLRREVPLRCLCGRAPGAGYRHCDACVAAVHAEQKKPRRSARGKPSGSLLTARNP